MILKWVALLLLAAVVVGITSALPGRIYVGGLFEEDDEELEMAFRVAVEWVNKDETLLKNSRMIAMVEKLQSEDSFKANKLSCGLLQKGIVAIFGPQREMTSMHVQSICDDLEVPHVECRWEYRLIRDQLSVNLYPKPSVISKAFVRVLSIWGWTDFFMVYEDDEAIIRLKDFFEEGEKQKWNIKLYQFKNSSSYRDTFWDIKRSAISKGKKVMDTEYRIVLDVSRRNLSSVLKAAQQVGMMTEHQKYLITSLDLHTVDTEDFQFSKTNISSLRLVLEETQDFQDFMEDVKERLDLRGNQAPIKSLKTESALIYDSVRLLAFALEQMDSARNISVVPPISCNLMNKGIDGTSLFNFMKNAKYFPNGLTGKIGFDSEGFRTEVDLDVMYVTPSGLAKIGTIEAQGDIKIFTTQTDVLGYFELENSHFKVSTYLNDPYAMYRESAMLMKGNSRFEGYGIDLLEALSKKLHFTYEINPVKDSKYGAYNAETETWNGMIGEVVNGDADMAIADLTITTERMMGVDFTLPFMQTGISILFKKPTTKVTSLFSFLSPFSGEVWLLVMAAYTFISISYFLVGRLSPYEWSNPHPCRQNDQVEENVFSLLNSMWFAIGSLMQQGSDIAPTAMSTRTITSIWYFFCLIMISSYTANLAAFLTVEKLVSPIDNVDDLAKQEKIKYGCLGSGSTSRFFQKSNMNTYRNMYKFMEKEKTFVNSNAEGIQKVKEGNYAYLMEATSIEYNTERECNLTQIGGLLDNKGYGIAVKKGNAKLRAWLSGGILKLQEEGELYTFKERWWKQKKGGGSCAPSKASGSVNELGLGNVGGVFVVMLLGICLSACMGVIEFLWYQRKLHRDGELSLFKLLMKEIKYAVTCGSSSKPAPKLKSQVNKEQPKTLPGYNSLF